MSLLHRLAQLRAEVEAELFKDLTEHTRNAYTSFLEGQIVAYDRMLNAVREVKDESRNTSQSEDQQQTISEDSESSGQENS